MVNRCGVIAAAVSSESERIEEVYPQLAVGPVKPVCRRRVAPLINIEDFRRAQSSTIDPDIIDETVHPAVVGISSPNRGVDQTEAPWVLQPMPIQPPATPMVGWYTIEFVA